MNLTNSLLIVFLLATFTVNIQACDDQDGKKGKRPELSLEQRECMDAIVGKPGDRESRPSHEEMKSAFESCGIEAPQKREKRS